MNNETVKNILKNVDKIRSCKALQGMTVEQLINGERFQHNLAAYLTEQKETRKTAIASYKAMQKVGGRGWKIAAHVIDHFMGWTVEQFSAEYINVIAWRSKCSRAERQYIEQLGRQAYNLTVAQYVIEEYPELADELLPKSKAN